jgi:hypothetical protein
MAHYTEHMTQNTDHRTISSKMAICHGVALENELYTSNLSFYTILDQVFKNHILTQCCVVGCISQQSHKNVSFFPDPLKPMHIIYNLIGTEF